MANTHYYGMIGDGHHYGQGTPPPTNLDPTAGVLLNFSGGTAPVINSIGRGGTSGAVIRVTRVINATSCAGEGIGIFAWIAGETCTWDSGGSTTVQTFVDAARVPLTGQYIPERLDPLTNSLTPTDSSDVIWWDRQAKPAQVVTISSPTGLFGKGDDVTTSGAARFTVLSTYVDGANLAIRVIRVTGTLSVSDTVTNNTQAGGGTIDTVGATLTAGTWLPHSVSPNLNGTLTTTNADLYEFVPNGNGVAAITSPGLGPSRASLGPDIFLTRKSHERHVAATDVDDRGVRWVPYGTFDDQGDDALVGGVSLQVLQCSGTFPTGWTIGETVTDTGTWSATLHHFDATSKRLYVYETNDATAVAGTITGGTSAETVTNDGAAFGWQKGSRYWNSWAATITAAQSAPNALWNASAAKWEGLFCGIWESELSMFIEAPWRLADPTTAEWVRFIADVRTLMGNPDLPIALLHMPEASQSTIELFGVPYAAYHRTIQKRLANELANVTLVHTDGMEQGGTNTLPYTTESHVVVLRTEDYVEMGWRAWRALQFGTYVIPAGEYKPMILIAIAGQSQAVAQTSSTWMALDGDPDIYSSATFPGVSTIEPNVWMFNAADGVMEWQNFDIAVNGNTFYAPLAGSFSPFMAAIASRMKGRFPDHDIGFIHIPVNASSCNVNAGGYATWDPTWSGGASTSASTTVTALAASGMLPARGQFDAVPGTYSSFNTSGNVKVSGSGLGLLGGGGNNNAVYENVNVRSVSVDGSQIVLDGAFVAEGPLALTLEQGPFPIWTAAKDVIKTAFNECNNTLQRVPKPALLVWWNWESDLPQVSEYQGALQRVLDAWHDVFSMRHTGETKMPTVIVKASANAPQGSDQDLLDIQAAQVAVAAALTNAATVNTDKVPFRSNGTYPRTSRQDNEVHHTARGAMIAGFSVDFVAEALTGIPVHPGGGAVVDFGDDGFDDAQTEEDVPAVDNGGGDAASATTVEGANSIVAVIDAAISDGADVASYTINGRTVTMHSMSELLNVRRYFEAQASRAKGLRRTKVSF